MPGKELYRLADEFYRTRLWERLSEDELFAVGMPDGATGYCCVMGRRGEHTALAVYPGSEGMDSYRRTSRHDGELDGPDAMEFMMSLRCVMCSYESRADLNDRDLREIAGHGLKFRGKNAYPVLRSHKPGRVPWYLEGADEMYLARGLEAGLEVARRLKGGLAQQDMFHPFDTGAEKAELGFAAGDGPGLPVPLLKGAGDGTFEWGTVPLPEPAQQAYPSPGLADDIMAARLKKTQKSGAWECEVFMYASPVMEGDGTAEEPENAPFFPYALIMVSHEDGMVRYAGMAGRPDDYGDELIKGLAGDMLAHGVPREILVRDRRTFSLLAGITERAGIRLSQREELPFMAEAREDLARFIGGGYEDGTDTDPGRLPEARDTEGPPDGPADRLPGPAPGGAKKEAAPGKAGRPAGKAKAAAVKPAAGPAGEAAGEKPPAGYVIRVTLEKGCYRDILISSGATLRKLNDAIQDAFGFDNDHLHAFFMDNRAWSRADSYMSGKLDDVSGRLTSGVRLGEAGLYAGKRFLYLFDFGDEWRFACRVLSQTDTAAKKAVVVKSVGTAPPQYDGADEDEEEEGFALPEAFPAGRLAKLYKGLAMPDETSALLHAYFAAFSNLYGIIPLRKALEIYNTQNDPLPEERFAAFTEIVRHEKHCYFILGADDQYPGAKAAAAMDREIVEESLAAFPDEYMRVMNGQTGKPYYIPGKAELLRYADDGYFEQTPEYLALRDYLRHKAKLRAGKADEITGQLQLHAEMGENDFGFILGDMKRMGLTLQNDAQLNTFIGLFTDMSNNTRIAANRGHTPNELAAIIYKDKNRLSGAGKPGNALVPAGGILQDGAVPADAPGPKPDRNAPCPCGSGRKYKRCCGKPD